MLEVVNLSSKGQLVIPKDMREEMGLNPRDKFVMVNDKEAIILKRIKEDDVKSRMISLMKYFTNEFKKAGVTPDDLTKEIKAVRRAR
ncbi:MAG TPA: AbrB/MazE/SpoVT family DNA-binding domain-containing protein [Candidatus Nanoarchaeia archaeon]|nr:AbrB/MazE/SpoVT family DNA-binding domain-containing protein [Candidatus Nanoarchaeia archaeon]